MLICSENGLPPPGAVISARKMVDDPRAEPQYGERVPYVVRTGAPGARLIDRVVSPEEMLKSRYIYPVERLLIVQGHAARCRVLYHQNPHTPSRKDIQSGGCQCSQLV